MLLRVTLIQLADSIKPNPIKTDLTKGEGLDGRKRKLSESSMVERVIRGKMDNIHPINI